MAVLGLDSKPFVSGLNHAKGAAAHGGMEIGSALSHGINELLMKAGELFATEKIFELVHSSVEEAEKIYLAAQRLGISTEKVQELGFAAKMTGGDLETLVAKYDKLAIAIEKAKNGDEKLIAAFQRQGVQFEDLFSDETAEVFEKIQKAVASSEASSTKTADMVKLFGKGGGGMIPMMKEMEESTKFFQEHKGTLAFTDEDVTRLHHVDQSWKKLGNTLKVFAGEAFLGLTVTLKDITNRRTEMERVREELDKEHAEAAAKEAKLDEARQQAFEATQKRYLKQHEDEAKAMNRNTEEAYKMRVANDKKADDIGETMLTKRKLREKVVADLLRQRHAYEFTKFALGENDPDTEKRRAEMLDTARQLANMYKPHRLGVSLNEAQSIGAYTAQQPMEHTARDVAEIRNILRDALNPTKPGERVPTRF